MSIEIKNTAVFQEILSSIYHPKLISMLCWIIDTAGIVYLTSGYRLGDTGVHGTIPCRGMDIRSRIYVSPRALCVRINAIWKYDPDRRPEKRCALIHGMSGNKHIHLQVHPKTICLGA